MASNPKKLFDVDIRATGEHAVVTLSGEIDLSTLSDLDAQVSELARDGVRHVVFNLAEVEFMDSTGLAAIISEHQRVKSLGGELILLSPPPAVRRLFSLTGLDEFLDIRPPPADGRGI
jgi:anti-sigma B factor antagonist